jgi:hypothetical protein
MEIDFFLVPSVNIVGIFLLMLKRKINCLFCCRIGRIDGCFFLSWTIYLMMLNALYLTLVKHCNTL